MQGPNMSWNKNPSFNKCININKLLASCENLDRQEDKASKHPQWAKINIHEAAGTWNTVTRDDQYSEWVELRVNQCK